MRGERRRRMAMIGAKMRAAGMFPAAILAGGLALLAPRLAAAQKEAPDGVERALPFADLKPEAGAEALAPLLASLEKPAEALALLKGLPPEFSGPRLATLRAAHQRVIQIDDPEYPPLARELLLTLGRHGDTRSVEYLARVFEGFPEARADAAHAVALYTHHGARREDDWQLLLRSLPVVDGEAAREVLRALAGFRQKSVKPHWRRHALLAGLRSDEQGAGEAARVLRHWTGQAVAAEATGPAALEAWRDWLAKNHPDLPPAALPQDDPQSQHKLAELTRFLASPPGRQGDISRGASVFTKAQCVKCHKFRDNGEAVGPDLTTLRARMTTRQMLEAVLFPNLDITEDYEAQTIVTKDGKTHTGVVTIRGGDFVVLQVDTQKITVPRKNVESVKPHKFSAMPEGLFKTLSREEITDLFAYLRQSDR